MNETGGNACLLHLLVRVAGLEPARLTATDFKSVVSAYSTIPADWRFKPPLHRLVQTLPSEYLR